MIIYFKPYISDFFCKRCLDGKWTNKQNSLVIAHVYDPGYYLALDFLTQGQGITRDDYLYNWEILYPYLDILEYKGPNAHTDLSYRGYGLNTVLEYCHKTNYTIPTTLDKTLFPNQGCALAYGKEVPIIYIR